MGNFRFGGSGFQGFFAVWGPWGCRDCWGGEGGGGILGWRILGVGGFRAFLGCRI